MNIEPVAGIEGAFIGSLKIHNDARGSFGEIFRQDLFNVQFVQANHSVSNKGVLRGLHWHKKQSDAWYVIGGHAQVMLADLRPGLDAPVVVSLDMAAAVPQVLLIPPGVAHGFYAVTDVDLIYWVTHYYDASDEFGVAWDDPILAAPWKADSPVLSERDRNNPNVTWPPEQDR